MPSLNLPPSVQAALEPLFELIPMDQAMGELVPGMQSSPNRDLVAQVLRTSALDARPELAAGVWLYADDLDMAHRVSQDDSSQTGSMWHAIVHRREGDFWNSGYWLRKAGKHPAFSEQDPAAFLSEVESRHNGNPEDLVERQREEWSTLFSWCAKGAV
jgi:hypothetical protein